MAKKPALAKLVKDCAKANKVEPHELQWNQFQTFAKGQGRDVATEIRDVGGWREFLFREFGAKRPKNPLSFTEFQAEQEKQKSEIAAKIAETIADCADELGVEPCDLTYFDWRDYTKYAWGESIYGIVPRDITKAGGWRRIRDAYFPPKPTAQGIERRQLEKHALINRKLAKEAISVEHILQRIEDISDKVFKGRITPVESPVKAVIDHERVLTIVLSDLHIGADIDGSETGGPSFGPVEEARRLAKVVQQVISYKPEYRECTRLRVVIAGDVIEGKLHDVQDGAELAEQICRAIHLLVQAIQQFAAHFHKVDVHCTPGNHDRDKARHHGRATSSKHDAPGTVIYYALKKALAAQKNVTFHIPKVPYCTWEDFGKKYVAAHGDGFLYPGNPGKSVQTQKLENDLNRINAALNDRDEYAVAIVGHVHTPLITQLANGVYMVINGALKPLDQYLLSLSMVETVSVQVMFEAVEGHPVGDQRFISLTSETDRDETLDALVQAWTGY